jgi:hypothetical protein
MKVTGDRVYSAAIYSNTITNLTRVSGPSDHINSTMVSFRLFVMGKHRVIPSTW